MDPVKFVASQTPFRASLFRHGWKRSLARAFDIARQQGLSSLVGKAALALREVVVPPSYRRWVALYDTLEPSTRQQLAPEVARMSRAPVVSVLMPVCDDSAGVQATIASLRSQIYPHWTLSICAPESAASGPGVEVAALARQDRRIRLVDSAAASSWAGRANRALEGAEGDYVLAVDPGDVLAEHALYWIAREALAHPEAALIFSDEDVIRDGVRENPWFKPDWNPALMMGCNAVGRLAAHPRALVDRLGGFCEEFEGAEEYELVLRCARAAGADRIRHVARVLYHRAARTGRGAGEKAEQAGRRAAAEHLAAEGIAASVHANDSVRRVDYAPPARWPRVSVVVATTAQRQIAEPCLASLARQTIYDDFECIVLVRDRDLERPERAGFLQEFARDQRFRIISYATSRFNYSEVNNHGARESSGEVLCFLNDDTEALASDWLQQLVLRVTLPGVAAAGAMLYAPDQMIQHAGVVLGLGGVAGHVCQDERRGSAGYFGRACLEQDVSCVTAACMAVRADVFHAVGGFDEELPLAYNDVDLCLRIRAAGWRIVWTPAPELIHRESASFGRHNSHRNVAQFARDVERMQQRWKSALQADPFYNRNLSLERGFALAFPPRQVSWWCSKGRPR